MVNLNNIQNSNLIITGTILKVPNNNVENVSNNYYIVKKGDTLFGIEKKYNTTWKKYYHVLILYILHLLIFQIIDDF